MDIWLDTTSTKTISQAIRNGLLAGVTTNPTLIAQTKRELEEILEELLHDQEGPVAAQVVAEDVAGMVQQGQNLHFLSNRIIVKVPMTKNGLEALHLLARQGIPTMATVIYNPLQALLAALAGADYVAPYVGRLEKEGGDPWTLLKTIMQLFKNYQMKTKILGGSLYQMDQVLKCAEIGIQAVTIKDELFNQLIQTDSLTEENTQQFAHDWKNVQTPIFAI